MKEIKKKPALKDIKALDKSVDVSHRMKNAYIRTKDQAEQRGHDDNADYVDNAGNNVRGSTETAARKAGHTAASYSKNMVRRIKEGRTPENSTPYSSKAGKATGQNATKSAGSQAIKQNDAQSAQPARKQAAKRKFTLIKPNELGKRRFVQSRTVRQLINNRALQAADNKAAVARVQPVSDRMTTQTVQPFHITKKAGSAIKQPAGVSEKAAKVASKEIIKTSRRSIKTIGRTVKTSVKTSHTAAKTATKAAKSVRTQRALQSTRVTARVAAISAKTALKALVATLKAAIAAAKTMAALIAAGGTVAIVVILVICLAGLLLGSAYGVFFSSERPDEDSLVMPEIVNRINSEFAAEIQRIQDDNPHDALYFTDSSSISNWREVLVVYAVRTAADPENGMEVTTLDDTKVGILWDVFQDMNRINYRLETVEHEETVSTTDDEGNVTEETVTTTETILHINVTSRTYADMISEYNFNPDQVRMMNELMKDEYQQLFIQLTDSR